MTLIEVEKIVEELTEEEQEILLQRLIEKTDPINPEIEHANIEVVRRRWNDIVSGKVKPVPLEEAFAEIDRLTDEKNSI